MDAKRVVFEIRCSCGGIWEPRIPLCHNDIVYVCNRMEEYAGMGVRHRPVHWQIRCQNHSCSHGVPVVLQGEDIEQLPGFKGFDRRNASFAQSYDIYWECRTGHDKDLLTRTLLAYCPDCQAEIKRQDATDRRRFNIWSILKARLPRRPALRFQDIMPECRQTFKKSVKGRHGCGKAENAFYAHVLYRNRVHEDRIEALKAGLEALKLDNPGNQEIQSMHWEFLWKPAGDGLSVHSLSVSFPYRGFSFTFTV